MTDVIRCAACHTVIAVGRIEQGAVQIMCKRCHYKNLVIPKPVVKSA